MNKNSLRILTLNVWNREGPWQERLKLIKSSVAELNPDVIGVQEAADPAHLEEMFGELGYRGEWFGTTSGVAIVSRWPLSDRRELWLPPCGDEFGGFALSVCVSTPYGDLPFTSATTAYFMAHQSFKRELQMPALNEFARSTRRDALPAILVGDFNSDPESSAIRFLKGLQSLDGRSTYWLDAWEQAGDGTPGFTWSRSNGHAAWAPWPNRRVDYIFSMLRRSDGAGDLTSCAVTCNLPTNGVWPSDHYGVLATFSV